LLGLITELIGAIIIFALIDNYWTNLATEAASLEKLDQDFLATTKSLLKALMTSESMLGFYGYIAYKSGIDMDSPNRFAETMSKFDEMDDDTLRQFALEYAKMIGNPKKMFDDITRHLEQAKPLIKKALVTLNNFENTTLLREDELSAINEVQKILLELATDTDNVTPQQ
jgi:hypothetical protein